MTQPYGPPNRQPYQQQPTGPQYAPAFDPQGYQPPQQPPQGHRPPKKRRTGLKILGGLAGVVVIFAIVGAIASNGGSGPAATAQPSAASAEPAATDDQPASPDPVAATPGAGDIKLRVKILKKSCFGSAGCNVTYTIRVTYSGASLPEGTDYQVTYRVTGGESPQINTLTLNGTQASVQQEESVSTPSAASTLRAKVTDVEAQ